MWATASKINKYGKRMVRQIEQPLSACPTKKFLSVLAKKS
jgi:hypothetical protein